MKREYKPGMILFCLVDDEYVIGTIFILPKRYEKVASNYLIEFMLIPDTTIDQFSYYKVFYSQGCTEGLFLCKG